MRIIIAGAGDVGFHLAKLLVAEAQEIIVIDDNKSRLDYVEKHLDLGVCQGNATSISTLRKANVQNADLLISATNIEAININVAIIGKKLGAKKTIARIENSEFLRKKEIFNIKELGIDELIIPELLAAKEIKRLLKEVAFTDIFEFGNGLLTLIGVNIAENCLIKGKALKQMNDLAVSNKFVTVAILRNNETIIPRGDNEFRAGDHAYFIALPESVDTLLELCGQKKKTIQSVMIMGGSKVGFNAAKALKEKYKVTLIERDHDTAFKISDKLEGVMVYEGDGRDIEFLKESGLENMDAFIGVTGRTETNILTCLAAKNHNVSKTIALVENVDYFNISQSIGVDTMINKKLIAANFIFRDVRKGVVVNLTSIHGVDAEILEFEVKENSKIVTKEIKDLDFPESAVIGGVIRRREAFIAMGNFQFKPKDRVVVLARPKCIRKVESFFK